MINRRTFLSYAAHIPGSLLLTENQSSARDRRAVSSKSLRILILGGTGYIGPYYVAAAVESGHCVSVFSRGKSQASLPASVERLFGDRNGDLQSIANRDWDAVVDLQTFLPRWVRSLGEELRGRATHYTFISSATVYDNSSVDVVTREDGRVAEYRSTVDPYSLSEIGAHGRALKAICECEAEKQFPGGALILRPGYIAGPNDPQAYLTYWPARVELGGRVLIAGSPSTPVQYVDVRDLAEWSLRMIERRATGTYNVVGPAVAVTLQQMVDMAQSVASTSSRLTWVPSSLLAAQPDREMWRHLLFWTFEREGLAYIMRMSSARALANGLTLRPLRRTLADTFEWYKGQLSEDQARLLFTRRGTNKHSGYAANRTSWPDYLDRERQVLLSWSDQGSFHG